MFKALIGALVGAIIVFGWQAASNTALKLHEPEYRQVENQDAAIQALSGIFKEDGQYVVPRPNTDASHDEAERFMKERKGKPYALVSYHAANKAEMGTSIFRSFITAFLCVLIFILVLGKNPGSFLSIWLKSIGIALFVFLLVYYNEMIWLQSHWEAKRPELYDLLISWGICGLWLGFWLNRSKRKA